MTAYIIRRILYSIPIAFGVTLILFLIFNVVAGDPALLRAGKHATPEVVQSFRVEMGLDQPLHVQYLNFIKGVLNLDFGRSYSTKQDILDMIKEGAVPSLSLIVPPFLISVFLATLIGAFVAYYRGSYLDKGIVALAVAGQSVSLLVWVLAAQFFLAYKMNLFPISGYDSAWDERWAYLILPGMVYCFIAISPLMRFYRTVILDEKYQDYVRTARAKGLTEKVVMLKHVMKNAMIPIITDLFIQLPFLILGSLVMERFFSIPGLGDMLVQAITDDDRPVLMAMTLMGSFAYIVFNILSDLLYALVDPRVQLR